MLKVQLGQLFVSRPKNTAFSCICGRLLELVVNDLFGGIAGLYRS